MQAKSAQEFSVGFCDGCGTPQGPFLKLSLGKDFFGRPYDRLSPSSDQSPKWYCEACSLHKNLQRDFRDIRTEFEKFKTRLPSELAKPGQLERAHLRLREIMAVLNGSPGQSCLLDPVDVNELLKQLQAALPTSAG